MDQIDIEGLQVQVVRKTMRTLRLTVSADGSVRVSAPRWASKRAIRSLVTDKIDWIRRHQAKWAAEPPEPILQYVSGEHHLFQGRRYRLKVVEGPSGVVLGQEILRVSSRGRVALVLDNWYRQQLRELVPPLLEEWQAKIGVRASDWSIRKMKSRWGSCHTRTGHICLNLHLAQKPPGCLEYVIVHELVHLLEASHNRRFWGFMDQFMPDWREHKDRLNLHSSNLHPSHH